MTCQQPVIRAHSIQNARVIDLLEESGHVIALRPKFSGGGPGLEFKSVGRNLASTFTGMCSEHDRAIFAPLDSMPLNVRDNEQLFLLAYRSATRELHAVMEAASKFQLAYLSRVSRGLDPSNNPSPAGLVATQQLMNAYQTYQYRADNFDRGLLYKRYDSVEHDAIIFDDQSPAIAVSSLFSVDELAKYDNETPNVILNVVPTTTQQTVVVFSYTKEDRAAVKPILQRIFLSQGDLQKYELSKLILTRVENFLISPVHFSAWAMAKKETIMNAFASTLMAGTEPREHPDLMLF